MTARGSSRLKDGSGSATSVLSVRVALPYGKPTLESTRNALSVRTGARRRGTTSSVTQLKIARRPAIHVARSSPPPGATLRLAARPVARRLIEDAQKSSQSDFALTPEEERVPNERRERSTLKTKLALSRRFAIRCTKVMR